MPRCFITNRKILGATISVSLLVGFGVMQRQHLRAQTTNSSSVLLYGFVTAVQGYDTGLAITNASRTPSNMGQSGTCSLSYFGVGAPPSPQTTPVIPAGGQLAFSLSSGGFGLPAALGFQGYIIAVCGFPSAQGVAAVSNVGASRFLSLVPATAITNTTSNSP